MERTMWSDERLDDRLGRIDQDLRELRAEFRDLRHLMFMLWGPTMLGILASIAAALFVNS